MYKSRFTITEYDFEVDYAAADSILEGEESYPGDLSQALEVLNSGCWDSLDERDSEVICYPADWDKDLQTGTVTHTDVVVKADKPENLRRLMNLYNKDWPTHPPKPVWWRRLLRHFTT